jgi:hypothetical protein
MLPEKSYVLGVGFASELLEEKLTPWRTKRSRNQEIDQ